MNEKATASVYALDHCGKPCMWQKTIMTCELFSEGDAKAVQVSIKMILKDNQCEISYCPTIQGRHQLHIKFDGKHIQASPFSVMVRRPFEKLGTPIMTITGLSKPWGVVVNKMREIIIAESEAHCISIFSQTGEKLRSFGSYGKGQGQFKVPRYVAVDDDGNILVIDSNNHHIQKFTASGEFITAVGSHGVQPLQFKHPAGIAIHPISNRLYVSDSFDH